MKDLANSIFTVIKPIICDDVENAIVKIAPNDETAFTSVFDKLEHRILCLEHATDLMKAALCVLSGKILLQAKTLVGHGKWKFVAHRMFPLSEHERNIRMKAASIVDVEKYLMLGWKRISTLADAFKVNKVNNPFQTIMKNMNYTIDPYNVNDAEHFYNLVNAYTVWNSFDAKLKSKIKTTQMVDAIERGIVFNKTFIDYLSKQTSPSTALTNFISYGTGKLNYTQNNVNKNIKKRELATCLHSLIHIGSLIVDYQDTYLSKVSLDLLGKAHSAIDNMMVLREMNKLNGV